MTTFMFSGVVTTVFTGAGVVAAVVVSEEVSVLVFSSLLPQEAIENVIAAQSSLHANCKFIVLVFKK
jgi:hypothetical protein